MRDFGLKCANLEWLPRPIALGFRRQPWRAVPLSDSMRHGLSDAAPRWRGPPYIAGIRTARLFGRAAYAILNKLIY
eukprot:3377723-Pleurochrysis_carterae.AAC.3